MTATVLRASALAYTTDPSVLVPGSVEALHGDATDLAARAAELRGVGERVAHGIETPTWEGEAYESWAVRRTHLETSLSAIGSVFSAAAEGIHRHADTITWARALAEEAVVTWARGSALSVTCAAAVASVPTPPWSDPGASLRADADAMLSAACDVVAESGARLTALLDRLSDGLPDGEFHGADFFEGVGCWASDLASDAYEFGPGLSPVSFFTPRYRDAVRAEFIGLEAAWDVATTDPLALPAAITDAGTLEERPGAWWGRIAPDIALGVGGIGTARVAGRLSGVVRVLGTAERNSRWIDDIAARRLELGAMKVPAGWGPGVPNGKGVGTRWFDPAAPQANGVRIDQGIPDSRWTSQQVDHVVVRRGGMIIGPDGTPISGPLREHPHGHVPLSEWLTWTTWDAP